MDLKELLGDAYKENMTFDEISTALSSKKLADLSTGKYVNKEASEADKLRLENEKKELERQLNEKLTDDEKFAKVAEEKDKQIQKLLNQLKENTINSNREKIYSATAEMRGKLKIESEDEDFSKFAGLITLEKAEDNSYVSNYLAKIIKSAYDKGVEDTEKAQVAGNKLNNGKNYNDGDNKNEDYGARLAKKNKEKNTNKFNYFE